MRTLPVLAVLCLAALSGCLDDDAPLDGSDGSPGGGPDLGRPYDLSQLPQFCEEESACDFWDEAFHEYVVYDLDTTVLDVIVVPPATPDPLVHTDAARLAVENWRDGIEELGTTWFTANFTMNVYTLGVDVPTPEALADPEIVVLSGGATETLVGIGLEPKQIACTLFGDGAERTYEPHRHGDVDVRAADCTGYGFTCFAINAAGAPGGERDLYDLVAHEVGHCLGAGHVGDALDFRSRYAPIWDIMSYQSDPEQVHCVSNLNVRVLEGVYAHLLDRPQETWLPAGSYLEYAPADYAQVACENPPS